MVLANTTAETTPERLSPSFPMAEARLIARRFSEPDPKIYWTDFLISAAVGWAFFIMATMAPPFSVAQGALTLVSSLAFYRAVIFTHELAHLKRGAFGAFRFVWNVLAGVPFLVPSFSYTGVHIDHHRPGIYASKQDGEYAPFGAGKPWLSVVFVLASLLLPLALILRFLVLTPLSYVARPLRGWLWTHFSSLAIDPLYVRHAPGDQDDPTWKQQELAAFVFVVAIAGLVAAGLLPLAVVGVWYAVTAVILLVNSIRTLAAHAYRHDAEASDARALSRVEEFLDSVNVPGVPWFTPLWAPVGLRFHATHHLFPATPYHNLAKLHAALMSELPDTRVYEMTARRGLVDALVRLWQDASNAQRSRRAAIRPEAA